MSIQAKIKPLKELSAIDADLQVLGKELEAKRTEIDEKMSRYEALAARTEHLEDSVAAMEGTRNELVGELRQTANQVDKSRDKMARCRNEREANAVQRELEELRRVHRERDQEIQKLVGLIDEARTDLEKIQAEKKEITDLIDETQGEASQSISHLQGQIADKQKEREALCKELPGLLLRRYEAVKKRRGSALSAAIDGCCAACNIQLPPMLFQQIMQQVDLKDCPSCHRILYFADAEEVAEREAAQQAEGAETGEAEQAAADLPSEESESQAN